MHPEEIPSSSQPTLEQQFALWSHLPEGCRIGVRDLDDAHELVVHRRSWPEIRREWKFWSHWGAVAQRWGCTWIKFTYGGHGGAAVQSYGAVPVVAIEKLAEL